MKRRIFSILLSGIMVFSLCSQPVHAEENRQSGDTPIEYCEHHTEHTTECGYVAPVEGHECEHVHDESCGYQEGSECKHVHDDACSYDETGECTHVHDDSCGYAEGSECKHVHDDACGYVESSEGSPCTFVCEICEAQEPTDVLPDTEENFTEASDLHGEIDTAKEALMANAENTITFKELDGTKGADGENYDKLVDGKKTSGKWCVTNFKGAYIVFKASERIYVDGYTITTGNDNLDNKNRNPKDWTLKGCNNYDEVNKKGGDWEDISVIINDKDLEDKNYTDYDFTFTKTTTPYQYFKLEITATQGDSCMQMGEFTLSYIPCEHVLGTDIIRTIAPTCTEGGYNVYECTKCGSEIKVPNSTPVTGHDKGDDGKCKNCGTYMISDAAELKDFAADVNDGETSANAILTADITVNSNLLGSLKYDDDGNVKNGTSFTAWTPIYNYTGTFDGQGHTISGLYFDDAGEYDVGLFGSVGDGGSVLNVSVVDSYFQGCEDVGGVCGMNYGTIENCYNAGAVNGGYLVGGLCGVNCSIIENCYNTGAVDGAEVVGGICGQNEGTIKNCYNAGAINGDSSVGDLCGEDRGTVTNCYYLSKTAGSVAKIAAQFKKGEVAYLLSKGCENGGSIWGQKIGTDDYPVLKGDTVYATTGCVTYNNSGDTNEKEHHNDKGRCTDCGKYIEPENKDGVYQISKVTELYWLADTVGSGNTSVNAVLTNDITVNSDLLGSLEYDDDGSVTNEDSFTYWTPIGNYDENPYTGTFDGQGHTISGLYFNDKNASEVGLFGAVGEDGSVSNVGILDSYFKGNNLVGGVCGYNNGTIKGCYAICTADGRYDVGGVCGYNDYKGTIINCCSDNRVPGRNAAIGYDDGDSTNVSSKSTAQFASGEVAYLLNGSTSEGSLVWGQTLSGESADAYPKAHTDTNTVYATTGCVTYNNLGDTSKKEHHYENGRCTVCGKYTEPENKGGIYQISNRDELYWLADTVGSGNASVNAVLTKDITVNTDVLKADGTLADDVSGFTSWTPIGYYNSDNDYSYYTGTFDGQGHIISGLYFDDADTDYVGLFGYVGRSGSVLNVGVVDSYFSGSATVGSVCGYNYGTITNCHNEGTVSGRTNVGGVCGYNKGTITNCYNEGAVSGSGWYVGGVCGYNKGTTTSSYNMGSVSGSANVGGVCGTNYSSGTITNCYNMGTVSGDDSGIGGVCGWNYNSGTITNCYNTGAVSGKRGVGDVCGFNYGTITNCYYLAESETDDIDGTTYKTAEDFQNGTVCNLVGYHSHQNGNCILCGNYKAAEYNDESGCYEISNAGQLYWFAGLVNGNPDVCDYDAVSNPDGTQQNPAAKAVLTADITVNSDLLDSLTFDSETEEVTNGTDFRSWTPIGDDVNPYTGTFDGQGHIVSGLYFNDVEKRYVGLFGSIQSGGCIKNVGVADSYFNGKNTVGGVCGLNKNGTIENCYNKSYVSGTEYIGGVCGYNYAYFNTTTIKNCHNEGKVSGSDYVGGVCGFNNNDPEGITTIEQCYNIGEVSGVYHVGGVCGWNRSAHALSEIRHCYNNGDVNGTNYVGGVCGYNYTSDGTAEIATCYNTGKVGGTGDSVGGVCGLNSQESGANAIITNCYYLAGCNTEDTTFTCEEGISKTTKEFASGSVCYLLNGKKSEGTEENPLAWYQNIDRDGETADAYPVLDNSHGTVYQCTPCTVVYSNTQNETAAHSFTPDENGTTHTCEKCGTTESHSTTNFTYSAAEETNRITVYCNEGGCGANIGYVELEAPYGTITYNGFEKEADVSDTVNYVDFSSTPITYKQGGNTLSSAPKDAGTYIASITLGEGEGAVTVSVEFTIQQATPFIKEAPAAAAITYGDTLGDSALSGGTVQHSKGNATTVTGSFTWIDTTIKPSVSDSNTTTYQVVFTPSGADAVNYTTAETTVTLTVEKAENAPNMPSSTMNVPYHCEKVSDVTLPEGWAWQDADKDKELTAGTAVSATAVYDGADKGNYVNETASVSITRETIPEGLWMEEIDDCTYNGKQIKPEVWVYYDRQLLTAGKDYTASYKNNTNAAAADAVNDKGKSIAPTVTVKGKGNYAGTVTKTFTIQPINLDNYETDTQLQEILTIEPVYAKFSGKFIKAVPTMKLNGKTISQSQYTCDYKDGNLSEEKEAYKDCGTYNITILGSGKNFKGKTTVTETISDKLISKVNITLDRSSYQYNKETGETFPTKVTVKDGKYTLTEGTDYTVSYQNYDKIGTATVIITGIKDYSGVKTKNYKITGTKLTTGMIKQLTKSFEYDGTEHPVVQDTDYTIADGTTPLVEGKNYTVTYTGDRTKAGTFKVTFKGIGSYSGTVTKSFTIRKASVSTLDVTIPGRDSVVYTKGGVKPKPEVRFKGVLLTEGTDYTVTYGNNTKAASAEDKKAPYLYITGKGNFTGNTRAVPEKFTIKQAQLNDQIIVVDNVPYKNKNNNFVPTVTIIDSATGKKLTKNTDYLSSFIYEIWDTDENDYVPFNGKKVEFSGNNIKMRVTVSAKGNYSDPTSAEYEICPKSITSVKVEKIPSQEYTGKAIIPELTITDNGDELIKGRDYTLEYTNNIKKGTASVTIRGKGQYGGSKTVKFNITSRIFKWS